MFYIRGLMPVQVHRLPIQDYPIQTAASLWILWTGFFRSRGRLGARRISQNGYPLIIRNADSFNLFQVLVMR